ncbi:MAG TPA: OmpA family protein [Kofleriaceae bacterium]|nr:OmpA family protein [Kofleriaceae bacterium]
MSLFSTTLSVAVLVALGGCGSKPAPKTADKKIAPEVKAPTKEEEVAPVETTPVSPSLAVSPDLAKLCTLTRQDGVPPTFDYDKAELSTEDREVLQQLATCLTVGAAKDKELSLIGRADPRGTEEYNLGLGARRAHVVGVYLQRLGVAAERLGETTRGAIDASGKDEETWRRDRRVDLELR